MRPDRLTVVLLLVFAASVLVANGGTATSASAAAACGLLTVGATGTVQLPPEILVDRHLVRAERLLAAGDPGAALEAMNEILGLREEHDLVLGDDFYFEYAKVAFAAGRTETAIASLNEYLVAAGREGEFYREALELLDAADVRSQQEAVDGERLARWPSGEVFRDCELCPEMVVLPGNALALGRYEVTVWEYRAFVLATGGGGAGGGCNSSGASWRYPGYPQTDRHPVVCLSWDDAQAYVSWLSRTTGATYRLPTEAEWELGAVGSQPGCYDDRTQRRSTCPVGSYGGNPAGLSDMVGNVWEWTADCWDDDCGRRVLRGGSWFGDGRYLRPAGRSSDLTAARRNLGGFRVARMLD